MGIYRLHKNDVGRASGSISQMRGAKTKVLGKTDLETPTFKRTEIAQRDLGYDRKSNVRLFPFSFLKELFIMIVL
jgi:hypothetical protein